MILAGVGIVLVAMNLRTAVVSLSPIYDLIRHSFPVCAAAQGLLGTLPVLSFGVFGLLAPAVTRRFGLEIGLIIAMAMIGAGQLARACLGNSVISFEILSVVSLGGIGIANVLVPPAIKHYFPKAVGAMTSTYLVLVAVSASIPALVAVHVASAVGWRFSIGI